MKLLARGIDLTYGQMCGPQFVRLLSRPGRAGIAVAGAGRPVPGKGLAALDPIQRLQDRAALTFHGVAPYWGRLANNGAATGDLTRLDAGLIVPGRILKNHTISIRVFESYPVLIPVRVERTHRMKSRLHHARDGVFPAG
jgi:hypothetical protein